MNKATESTINIFFSLLVEAVNEKNTANETIFFYKFQGIIEGLFTADILTSEQFDYLRNAAWEVYFLE